MATLRIMQTKSSARCAKLRRRSVMHAADPCSLRAVPPWCPLCAHQQECQDILPGTASAVRPHEEVAPFGCKTIHTRNYNFLLLLMGTKSSLEEACLAGSGELSPGCNEECHAASHQIADPI